LAFTSKKKKRFTIINTNSDFVGSFHLSIGKTFSKTTGIRAFVAVCVVLFKNFTGSVSRNGSVIPVAVFTPVFTTQ
jgi:hypothetical protein